jgi:hypothetical protein
VRCDLSHVEDVLFLVRLCSDVSRIRSGQEEVAILDEGKGQGVRGVVRRSEVSPAKSISMMARVKL